MLGALRSVSRRAFVQFAFKNRDGATLTHVRAAIGDNLLDVAHHNKIPIEGACEKSLACSTCHVIFEPKIYEKLPEPYTREEDLLDLAPGLTDTSRLACQIKVDKYFEDAVISLPKNTLNFYVDGYIPTPH